MHHAHSKDLDVIKKNYPVLSLCLNFILCSQFTLHSSAVTALIYLNEPVSNISCLKPTRQGIWPA